MLESTYPDAPLQKEEYDQRIEWLRERAGMLQRDCRDRNIPVLIVFEGWRGSGISTTINKLTYALDPRGYRVHTPQKSGGPEDLHPLLWKYWIRTPSRGQFAIFDRSWYTDTLLENLRDPKKSRRRMADILNMERILTDDGIVIIKFFLHISRKEQKRRLKKIQKKRPGATRSDDRRLGPLTDYEGVSPFMETLISTTDIPSAPWTIVEAHDRHGTIVRVFEALIRHLERALLESGSAPSTEETPPGGGPEVQDGILSAVDLTLTLAEETYLQRLEECERQLHDLQYSVNGKKIPVIIVFEGWDAAGKGGAIIRLDRALNPRCSVVEPISAPGPEERDHHYLWRFLRMLPQKGNITIFDRSWYGRVLVERVERYCSEQEWRRAYHEINLLEEYLARSGTVIFKFWLHIDRGTQLKRFREREADPLKKYKITDEDWRNRKKWPLYIPAVEDMLRLTSTRTAPWTIVPSNDKYYSRITILERVITGLENAVSGRKAAGRKDPGHRGGDRD